MHPTELRFGNLLLIFRMMEWLPWVECLLEKGDYGDDGADSIRFPFWTFDSVSAGGSGGLRVCLCARWLQDEQQIWQWQHPMSSICAALTLQDGISVVVVKLAEFSLIFK